VVWADSGCAERTPGEQHYAQFRHMIHHFGGEFTRLTQATRR
jgi:hypothetical protein